MEDLLIGGGSVGGIGVIAVAAWKYLNSKKNGNGKSPDTECLQRIDRWTISHDAQTGKMVDLTTQQVAMTREMRDAILLMVDRRDNPR